MISATPVNGYRSGYSTITNNKHYSTSYSNNKKIKGANSRTYSSSGGLLGGGLLTIFGFRVWGLFEGPFWVGLIQGFTVFKIHFCLLYHLAKF